MIELEACSVAYGRNTVFSDVTVSVERGKTLAILGPSGCGKTTLLYTAAGLIEPASGRSTIDGVAVHRGDRRVGLVLQEYGLFPWFTVAENVELGLRLHGVKKTDRREIARGALAAVGMTGTETRYVATLSGGESQRVAIARTWALSPGVLLMDEPFSALDALSRETLQDMLRVLLRKKPVAAILVTHSIDEAVLLGSSIAVMYGNPARLEIVENTALGTDDDRVRTSKRYFEAARRVRAVFEERVRA
ncbi:MAG: ATP-binding cassette domain-containing protein [Spirochaetaceae bacterium]|nr:MAG: ATP-binding cassette domain-containing protein [Spirochaetaceae bacterium]